jgi:hypothetical protein
LGRPRRCSSVTGRCVPHAGSLLASRVRDQPKSPAAPSALIYEMTSWPFEKFTYRYLQSAMAAEARKLLGSSTWGKLELSDCQIIKFSDWAQISSKIHPSRRRGIPRAGLRRDKSSREAPNSKLQGTTKHQVPNQGGLGHSRSCGAFRFLWYQSVLDDEGA